MGKQRTRLAGIVVAATTLAAFVVMPVPPAASAPGDTRPGATAPLAPAFARVGANLVRLQVGAFDPLADPRPAPSGLTLVDEATLPAGTPQYWLVQVRDNRFAEATAAVNAAGASVAGVIPDGTYAVRATPAQRVTIAASPAVRWTGYYQPAWRMPAAWGPYQALPSLAGTQTYQVSAFRLDPDPASVGRALAALPGVRVVSDAGAVVDVEATAAELPAIAAIPAVEWVTLKPAFVPFNHNARWVIDTGERDQYGATLPGRLTGAGQTAAAADTAVNYKPDKNGTAHIAFRDCQGDDLSTCKEADYTLATPGTSDPLTVTANHTNHRKMAAFFDLGNAGPNPSDDASHGTHVAGSIAGDALTPGTWDGDDGMAPGARYVHEGTADSTGALTGFPTDYYDLFRMAYRPRNPGSVATSSPAAGNTADLANYVPTEDARTHNNSYGIGIPLVDPNSQAITIDQFVWDHEDMNIVVSASNAGPGAGTTASPAVGKNNYSSGASSNGRQPMVSIGDMANFSGHGPTADGRFGPTVATPGEIIVSPKGGTNDEYQYLQGTSMSGPILTGALTLVRQYFWDGYGPAGGAGFPTGTASASRQWNPSSALVRAAVVNGAERMRGWYTGTDGTQRSLDGEWPSGGQGFGRVNLDNSLYFANDPANNWYHDAWRDSPDAFALADQGASRTYTFDVAAGQPLDVTLAWTDAPNLLPAGTPALVNDLDLVVSGPSGTFVGNNMNSRTNPSVAVAETTNNPAAPPDTVNNTERVRVADPQAGTYTVTVRGSKISTANQGFALAASGLLSATGQSFAAGPARHTDQAGAPAISGVQVERASNDVARVRFSTSEDTTGSVTVTGGGDTATIADVYNLGGDVNQPATYTGMDTAPVETGPDYANKPVITKSHEIIVTGLRPGTSYSLSVNATDVGGANATPATAAFTTPSNVWQPEARDIGQLTSTGDQWKTGKQMYAGDDPASGGLGSALGAFMFRLPQSVDPSTITGAVVELTSAHDLSNHYNVDPRFTVDLLDDSVKPGWGTTDTYDDVHKAPSLATLSPATTLRTGAQQKLDFTLGCNDVAALKASLSTIVGGQRLAPFRWDSTHPGETTLVSMEFGFNRRSQGPDLRPKLILLTDGASGPVPPLSTCDPAAPAPVISDVRIDNSFIDQGANVFDPNAITVSWRTDLDSDSLVLFRPKGTTEWTQVGTPGRTKLHQVQIKGIDTNQHYEFGVRSAGCNGATTTADNLGAGWDLFRPVPPPPDISGTATPVASYNWETDDQGWTKSLEDTNPTPPPATRTQWTRAAPGASGTAEAQHAEPYGDDNKAHLTSPALTFSGTALSVDFQAKWDLEQATPATTTDDALQIEYSTDNGATWTVADRFQGRNPSYPSFDAEQVKFFAPAGKAQVRFSVVSDDNVSTPPYQGAAVDEVVVNSYNATVPTSDPFIVGIGPVVPKSAGASALGLSSVATRTLASAADKAAGTGAYCVASSGSSPGGPGSGAGATAAPGYHLVASDGGVFSFGAAGFFGSTGGTHLNQPIVGMATTPSRNGYWLVASDGGIFALGDAPFLGSMGGTHLNKPIVGIAATASGQGYWLVASDGGIFAFGDAAFLGSMGGSHLNQPIVAMAAAPSGNGYWLVASDGGVFTFGQAVFFGSMGGTHINRPVTGMAPTASGAGYWMVATDGGIFAFGDAPFLGSTGGTKLNRPIAGMVPSPTGLGYWLDATDGGVFAFGDAPFLGSTGGTKLNRPIVGMAA